MSNFYSEIQSILTARMLEEVGRWFEGSGYEEGAEEQMLWLRKALRLWNEQVSELIPTAQHHLVEDFGIERAQKAVELAMESEQVQLSRLEELKKLLIRLRKTVILNA